MIIIKEVVNFHRKNLQLSSKPQKFSKDKISLSTVCLSQFLSHRALLHAYTPVLEIICWFDDIHGIENIMDLLSSLSCFIPTHIPIFLEICLLYMELISGW